MDRTRIEMVPFDCKSNILPLYDQPEWKKPKEVGIEPTLAILETAILPLNYSSKIESKDRGRIELPFQDLQS